ncbi:MAG: enoyl-CoA hydratase-related protein [Arenicellales bacterium]
MEDRSNELKVSRRGGVLEIQLNRPKVNAIDFDLSRRINEAVVTLRDDPELRVGLVTAAGEKIFSAGWDLKALDSGEQQLDNWWEADADLPGVLPGLLRCGISTNR